MSVGSVLEPIQNVAFAEVITSRRRHAFSADGIVALSTRGKSAINRSTIALKSACQSLLGNRAMNVSNFAEALSFCSSDDSRQTPMGCGAGLAMLVAESDQFHFSIRLD